jgi:hypothetical protein
MPHQPSGAVPLTAAIRRPYVPPQLTVHGTVVELTANVPSGPGVSQVV